MELSRTERIMLSNQYEILRHLDPKDKKHYDTLLECLKSGYESEFFELAGYFEMNPSSEIQAEVREILEMFRALGPRRGEGGMLPAAARFIGFDGNDETKYMAYAEFLIEDRGLWRELKHEDKDYNTHCETLSSYREMLRHFRNAGDRHHLRAEEIKSIMAAAPYGSTHKEE
jgi:hypothetical protein